MLGAYGYKTKKELEASIGKKLNFVETSVFGPQYKESGIVYMVGPCAYTNRRWYAKITMKDGLIFRVE